MPSIPKELIDQFVTGPMSAEAVNDLSFAFKKALIERALGAELSHHLGYAAGATKPEAASNHRNGSSAKTVLTDDGALRIEVPRDIGTVTHIDSSTECDPLEAGIAHKQAAAIWRGVEARGVDLSARAVHLSDATAAKYDKLLLAVGAHSFKPAAGVHRSRNHHKFTESQQVSKAKLKGDKQT